jgi:O-antigen ligase
MDINGHGLKKGIHEIRGNWLPFLLIVVIALFSILLKSDSYVQLIGIAIAAVIGMRLVLKLPILLAVIFHCFYSIFSTIVGSAAGVLIPFYALFLFNSAYRIIAERESIPWSTLAPVIMLFVQACISLLWSDVFGADFLKVRMISLALPILVCMQISGPGDRKWLALSMWVTSIVLSVVAITIGFSIGFSSRAGSFGTIDTNENHQSAIIAGGVITGYWFLLTKELKLPVIFKLCILVSSILCMYALLLLASRSIFVAVILASVFTLVAYFKVDFKKMVVGALFIGLAVFMLSLLPGTNMIVNRFGDADVKNLNDRAPLWALCIKSFDNADLIYQIFGQGVTSSSWLPQRYSSDTNSVHNSFLQILVEYGIFGLLTFLVFFYRIIVQTFKSKFEDVTVSNIGMLIILLFSLGSGTFTDTYTYAIFIGWLLIPNAVDTKKSKQALAINPAS